MWGGKALNLVKLIRTAGLDDEMFSDGDYDTAIGGYHIQQNPEEFAGLIFELTKYPINNYLSIGTASGGADRLLCEMLNIKKLYSIDIDEHPKRSIWKEFNKIQIQAEVIEHLGDSHDPKAEQFLRECNTKFDLIGIDGDHSPCGVRLDWMLIQNYLKPGSIVWFHDISPVKGCQGAAELWQKVSEKFKVIYENLDVFGVGAVQV